MTVRGPLSAQSEVVDERRRWTADWYSWLTDLTDYRGLVNAANDGAAAAAGVSVGQLYRNGSVVMVRVV